MKSIARVTTNIKTIGFVFFLFAFLNSNAKGEDSLKNNFDLNDPRNPNCPCHRHQQQADEEYQQFLSMNNKNVPGNSNPVQNFLQLKREDLNPGSDKTNKNNNEKSVRHRRTKKIKKHNSWRRKFSGKNFGITRLFSSPTRCYRWN